MGLCLFRHHPLGYRLIPRADVLFYIHVGPYRCIIRSLEFKLEKLGYCIFYFMWKESGEMKKKQCALHN